MAARELAEGYYEQLKRMQHDMEKVGEEKAGLLRENQQLRSGNQAVGGAEEPAAAATTAAAAPAAASSNRLMPSDAVMANIGSLKMYEILLGLLFLSIVISWGPSISPF